MTLPARLTDTTQADLGRLVEIGATEGPHCDFKRDFPTRWDNETKVKVLADVTAFANAGGGDVIYGLDEDGEARASALVPQVLANVDEEVRRLMDIALNQTEPRVPGVQVHAVPVAVGQSAGHVVVMRVPQSWAAPHRNRINQHFHVREGQRNRTLDVPDIRALFLRSESAAQKLRDFRSDRLAKVVTGRTPVALGANPKLIVHAISTQAANGQAYIDPVSYSRNTRRLPVLGTLPASPISLNFDGAFGPIVGGKKTPGYSQQFRQGYFEAVWELEKYEGVTKPALPGVMYEQYVNNFLGSVRAELEAHGLSWEMAVFLSLVGADKAVLTGPSSMGGGWGHSVKEFDRADLVLPEVVIPADVTVGRGMRPAYDLMCQAAGYEGSPHYGEDGEWKAAR